MEVNDTEEMNVKIQEMEEPIKKIITAIKKCRSRPCYQSILPLLNKGGKQLEIDIG